MRLQATWSLRSPRLRAHLLDRFQAIKKVVSTLGFLLQQLEFESEDGHDIIDLEEMRSLRGLVYAMSRRRIEHLYTSLLRRALTEALNDLIKLETIDRRWQKEGR